MAVPEPQRAEAEGQLAKLCKRKYPTALRHRVRPEIIWERGALALYERREPWSRALSGWSRLPIARFRYRGAGWLLDCARTDGWRAYGERGPVPDIGVLIRDLEKDEAGSFWG